jgi:hypothetical protein
LTSPQLVTLLNMSQNNKKLPGLVHKTARLSEARNALAATSSGDLVFFGGGLNATETESARVDIYNVTSGSWRRATLSVARRYLAAASAGNLVFFGGGYNGTTNFNRVDICNVSDGSWSTAKLSEARWDLAATSVRNLVLFGGGYYWTYFNVVDIYNVTSNTWTTAKLSQGRSELAATSVANRYALFAGGWTENNERGPPSNVVDIYDSETGT